MRRHGADWPDAATLVGRFAALSQAPAAPDGNVMHDGTVLGGLAAGLLAASRTGRHPILPGGGRLRLVAVCLPGSPDLLAGVLEDQSLAVVQLDGANAPIASFVTLLDGVARVGANIASIAAQAGALLQVRLPHRLPRGLLVAVAQPPGALETLLPLRDEVGAACELDLRLVRLEDATLQARGLDGHILLRDIRGRDGAPPSRWPARVPAGPVGFVVGHIQSDWRRPPVPEAPPIEQGRRPCRPRIVPRPHQASTQDVARGIFLGLQQVGRLRALAGLPAEDGHPAFPSIDAATPLTLRHAVLLPGESRATEIDLALGGRHPVFVLGMLAEPRFPLCPQPGLLPAGADFARDGCSGAYRAQNDRTIRCSLSAKGDLLWQILPRLFHLDAGRDHDPCPVFAIHALARAVLALCLEQPGSGSGVLVPPAARDRRHALVIYDERNPAFWPGGEADEQWQSTLRLLRWPRLLRRVSWQALVRHLAADPGAAPIVARIAETYDYPIG